MLKRLLLLWILSGSLDGFSQAADTTQEMFKIDPSLWGSPAPDANGNTLTMLIYRGSIKPDTLRAIILVTLSPNGIAHARMGYVVIAEGKEVQYLDCRKRALKLPQVGWGYRVVNPNQK